MHQPSAKLPPMRASAIRTANTGKISCKKIGKFSIFTRANTCFGSFHHTLCQQAGNRKFARNYK